MRFLWHALEAVARIDNTRTVSRARNPCPYAVAAHDLCFTNVAMHAYIQDPDIPIYGYGAVIEEGMTPLAGGW